MGEYRFRVGECVRATGKAVAGVAGIVRERKTLIDGNVYKIDWFVDWKKDSQWSWMGEGELAPIEPVPDDDAMVFRFNVGDKVWTGSRPECGKIRLRHRVDTHKVYLVEWDRKSETTLEDEGNLRPDETRATPEDEFKTGDRVRHRESGRVGTLGGVKCWDGTFFVKWDESITTFSDHIHPRDLTRIDEKAEEPSKAVPTFKFGGRVRHNLSGRTGVVVVEADPSSFVRWDDMTTPYRVPDRDLSPVEEPPMPADPNAGRPTCATCPMMAVVPPTREVSVEASQKYPDANVHECHALPPARSLVMPWPPTTPDQFCGAHPDFQTWLDARDMARQGERPAREG